MSEADGEAARVLKSDLHWFAFSDLGRNNHNEARAVACEHGVRLRHLQVELLYIVADATEAGRSISET